jgi:hypothetical protein
MFGLCNPLGIEYRPELADMPDQRAWRADRHADHGPLNTLARGRLDLAKIGRHWPDILRVIASIYTGTVRAYDVIRVLDRLPERRRVLVALQYSTRTWSGCTRSCAAISACKATTRSCCRRSMDDCENCATRPKAKTRTRTIKNTDRGSGPGPTTSSSKTSESAEPRFPSASGAGARSAAKLAPGPQRQSGRGRPAFRAREDAHRGRRGTPLPRPTHNCGDHPERPRRGLLHA